MVNKKITIISLSSLLVIFLISILVFPQFKAQEKKLPAKIYLANIEVGDLDESQAISLVTQKCRELETNGLNIEYNEKEINIPSVTSSLDADLAYTIFYCNQDLIAKNLAEYQDTGLLYRLIRKVLPVKAIIIKPDFYLDELRLKTYILNLFPNLETEPIDASFVFLETGIKIQEEKLGQKINWERSLEELKSRLNYFSIAPAQIYTDTWLPEIYSHDLLGLETKAEEMTKRPLSLKQANKQWPINQADIASWLNIKRGGDNLSLNFDQNRIAIFLEKEIAPELNLEAKKHRFEMVDGKINNWQPGQNGLSLNINASAEKIIQDYSLSQSNESELIVDNIEPDEADSLNIKDIIGVGHSNFAGSPANRRHNIGVGIAALHGLTIKPDEEFSLVKALGEIDANSGYLPELVIKGNKTIPEYGGGLCQVATTLFRSALASGLPITARQNHSYRVSYYEPAGTDASVYDPLPDVKFINDTGNNILIQAKMEKNDVYLDFWGIKDGRVVEISEPVIYNIVAPPPKKIIETDSLAPGQIRCTESAHNGAKAYFDYTVTYPNKDEESGQNKQEYTRFNSTYVPWQEVCLVGKEKEIPVASINSDDNPETKDLNNIEINAEPKGTVNSILE